MFSQGQAAARGEGPIPPAPFLIPHFVRDACGEERGAYSRPQGGSGVSSLLLKGAVFEFPSLEGGVRGGSELGGVDHDAAGDVVFFAVVPFGCGHGVAPGVEEAPV